MKYLVKRPFNNTYATARGGWSKSPARAKVFDSLVEAEARRKNPNRGPKLDGEDIVCLVPEPEPNEKGIVKSDFVFLKPSSRFYPIFPGGKVPVNSFLRSRVDLEGSDEREVYMVDVARLTADEINRIVEVMADTPELRQEAMEQIIERGCPIRASQVVSAASERPWFL